jgi:hypothetical protein
VFVCYLLGCAAHHACITRPCAAPLPSPLADAPLAGILGGAHSGSLSPTAAAAAAQPSQAAAQPSSSQQDQQQQQAASQPPLRILEGPSTNPEPPLEGLSPPMARGELDSNMESEAGEGALHSALYALPSELRDPPPGEPDSSSNSSSPRPGVWLECVCIWHDVEQQVHRHGVCTYCKASIPAEPAWQQPPTPVRTLRAHTHIGSLTVPHPAAATTITAAAVQASPTLSCRASWRPFWVSCATAAT